MKILIAYATAHGSTREVGEFIGRALRAYEVEVTVANVKEVQSVAGYDAFVLGSAIHGSLWLQEMCVFIDQFHDKLAEKPAYFWINCIRALEADGREHALKYYFDYKSLNSINVRDPAVFTGKLNTLENNQNEQWFLIANYDGKLTPGNLNHDYRDWGAIAAWANKLAKELDLQPSFEPVERTEFGRP